MIFIKRECWDLEFPVLGDSNMSPQSSVTKIISFSLRALGPPIISKPSVMKPKNSTKNAKKFGRMINQAKLRNLRRSPIYKYGH